MALLWDVGTQTGFRVSDLLRLTHADVHNGHIFARERKTKKYRVEHITFQTTQNLSNYVAKNGMSDTDPLWPFTRQQVWRVIKRAGEACGISGLGAHSMRKTYAWLRLLESASVADVREKLLHAYESTTMQYLKPGLENAAKKGRLVF